jgi:hypothetical protein
VIFMDETDPDVVADEGQGRRRAWPVRRGRGDRQRRLQCDRRQGPDYPITLDKLIGGLPEIVCLQPRIGGWFYVGRRKGTRMLEQSHSYAPNTRQGAGDR